jgi:glycosyltransferase involved in cell wall biosynthesis
MRLHLELSRTLDPSSWQEQHTAGLVPDRLPYGLDRLGDLGFELAVRGGRAPSIVSKLDAVARRATGGLQLVHALRDRDRRNCELAVCWDERTGIPAALRSRLPGEPPAALGVIWLTESDEPLTGLGRALARRGLRSAAAVWTLSKAQLPLLAEAWRVDKRRLHFVRMGIDEHFWHQTDLDPEPGLVVAAGNDRHRDHALLVDAMSRLRRRRPSVRLELVTQSDVTVAVELGVRRPHLSHVEMRRLYERAAVVAVSVRPNLHVSGMSVLLEAMACGRPVVATQTPGIEEYVVNSETGLLVPPGDADAFAAAVGSLLEEPARARELGLAGRRAVESRFTTAMLAAQLADVLRAAGR